jgi:hypothetical protein
MEKYLGDEEISVSELKEAILARASSALSKWSSGISISSISVPKSFVYLKHFILHDRLQANAAPIQLPIGAEDEFEAIIDLVEMKCFKYTQLSQ